MNTALLPLLPAAGRSLTAVLAGAAVLQPAFGLGFILATGRVIGLVPHAIHNGLHGALIGWLVLVAACYGGQQLTGSAMSGIAGVLGSRIDGLLADRLMRAQFRPDGIGHLEDPAHQGLAERAMGGLGGARWRPAELPGAFASLLSAGLSAAGACVAVIWLQWWLGVAVSLALLWAGRELWSHLLRMTLDSVEDERTEEYRRLGYEYDLALSPAAAKELRVFHLGPWLLERVRRRHAALLAFDLRHMARAGGREIAALGVYVVLVAAGFAWIAPAVSAGTLSLTGAAVLAQALLAPMAQVQPVFQALIDLRQSGRPVPALVAVEARTRPAHRSPDRAVPPLTREIRCHDLRFRYPGAGTDVLRGLDLVLPAGASTALVGLNGAGKTTLIKLLCRFYEPTGGAISADGIDIADFDCAAWQSRIAAIFQDFARFPFTARDNVAFGRPAGDVERAARAAGASEVIEALPAGWSTPLTREVTGGVDLSGGQWQRVALARALLAAQEGGGLLILDEPAANLDVRSEAALNDRFLELTRGLTTLVVSHRFSTVRRADRICVLSGGAVAEQGTHAELLARGGPYARMFGLQAARFA